jgi:ubiquinol-cytochrome c reductase cytochrome b subunit
VSSEGTSSTEEPNKRGPTRPGLLTRLWSWIDQRTGVDQALRRSLAEPIPGGARFAYVFGSALLFIFVSQIVTGVCLALYYVPAPTLAHTSVAYIVKEVAAGSFLRSLHSYGSSAMIVVLVLHFLQTFLYGSYKGKRQLLWISGCFLALLVLVMAFTGYLLSWQQSAYSAGSVGTDIAGQVPFIGESIRLLLRGGAEMGALTLSRFYVLHILVVPGLIFAFVAGHLIFFRKAGPAGPVSEDASQPRLPTEPFYPKQVLIDMAFVLVVMGTLGALAHFVPVTLGLEADPSNATYLPRPEWYFLPMFQWLKYWEGWRTVIGVFIIPAILIGLVVLLPFIDRGPERRPWRRPIPVGAVLIIVLGMLWLGLTSHLEDSRDPATVAQLEQQRNEEVAFLHAPFRPLAETSAADAVASVSGDTTGAEGKGIFDAQRCSECHGANGGGAKGPALTSIISMYTASQLTALLKAPNAGMKAGGMAPLTLDDAKLRALVGYLGSLEGAPSGAATAPTSTASVPATAEPTPNRRWPQPKSTPSQSDGSQSGGVAATAKPSQQGVAAAGAEGKGIFEAQGCSGCHGVDGIGGKGPALTYISSKYPAAPLTALLKGPNAAMKAGGMAPLTLDKAKLKALVGYLGSLGGTASGAGTARTPTASAPVTAARTVKQPAAQPKSTPDQSDSSQSGGVAAAANPSTQDGEHLFKAQGCEACHGIDGDGTSKARALTNLNMTAEALTKLLQHPTSAMQTGGMPSVNLQSKEMAALVVYVRGLGAPGGVSGSAVASPAEPGDPVRGAKTYAQHCAGCHGTTGKGDGSTGRALGLRATNFTTTASNNVEWLKTIHLGSKATGQSEGMKGFAGDLSDKQIRDVLTYIKTFDSPTSR